MPNIRDEADAAVRAARVVELKAEGLTFEQIAAQVGYSGESGARQAYKRHLARNRTHDLEVFRDGEDWKLDRVERELFAVLLADHFAQSYGRVIVHPKTGEPLHDAAPKIAAANAIVRLSERRSRMRGGDAPMRQVTEEVTEDMLQAEMARINAMAETMERELIESGAIDRSE